MDFDVLVLCFVTQLFRFVYSSITVAPEERGKTSTPKNHGTYQYLLNLQMLPLKRDRYIISSQFTE